MKRGLIGIAAVACVLAPLSMAATAMATPNTEPEPNIPDGFTLADGMIAEYAKTLESFPLRFPEGIVQSRANEPATSDSALYEDGVGEGIAYFQWQCAWMGTALESSAEGDEQGLAEALNQLLLWETTPFYRDHVEEPTVTWVDDVVKPALAGNLERLSVSHEATCNGAVMQMEEVQQ